MSGNRLNKAFLDTFYPPTVKNGIITNAQENGNNIYNFIDYYPSILLSHKECSGL